MKFDHSFLLFYFQSEILFEYRSNFYLNILSLKIVNNRSLVELKESENKIYIFVD